MSSTLHKLFRGRGFRLAAGLFLGVFALLAVGCADDVGPRRSADIDDQERYPLYERPYRRAYGPWDTPGRPASPGPPTWYGCPQQSPRCYPE